MKHWLLIIQFLSILHINKGWEGSLAFKQKEWTLSMPQVLFPLKRIALYVLSHNDTHALPHHHQTPSSTILTPPADLVILATGAWTPSLINLQGRAIATGQCLAYISITDAEQEQFGKIPPLLNVSRLLAPSRFVLQLKH